ncbi:cytochrome P450 2C70-like [Physella acuta]|uniref:cytochrome P450 2C70-like n=1 Tax=Physella acuta TaxID=109671 RepID=UPI0027DC48D3|nr:cytochrome P450 2C70-like [Physella acuta]
MVFELLSDVGTTTWLAVLLVLVLSWYWTASQSKNLPPSPGIALPFIGHMYLLEKNPRKQFERWVKRFGPAFSLRFGMNQVVVLNTYDVLKEALVKQGDHFSDRPTTGFVAANLSFHSKGVIFSSGANWKEQRTTSLAILRTFGMGKNILADKISFEVSKYIEALSESGGKPTDIRTLTNISFSNDATVAGYTIPKGTQVLPYLDAVLMDVKIWGVTSVQSVFLTIKATSKTEELIPFSLADVFV